MGSKQSILQEKGYKIERETEHGVVVTKTDDTFLIRKISLAQVAAETKADLLNEIEILKTTNHPHIVSSENSFQDGPTYYIVMDYCQGGSLAEKIKEQSEQFEEEQILSWIVQICVALKYIHDKQLLHKDMKPESKETVKELQTNLDKLRTVADGLERVHQGTTIGSLTGGVIGAAGGITSIVGLILAPFTLGASLVVTGVGVGVATVGGLTAGVSNIKNIVNQSSDRKAIQSLIKEFKEKTEAVVMWIQVISEALEYFSMNCDSVYSEESNDSRENVARLGLRAGRGLAGVAELVRLIRVINIGKVAAQAARAVRVAEVAGGVLAGLFVAVDVFFIAMDAKEIHHIRQARAAEAATATDRACSETMPENDTTVSEPKSDKAALVPNTEKSTTEQKAQSTAKADTVKSEIMRFVRSVRKTAEELQKVVDDLKFIVAGIPSLTSPEG
ncbi:apolipoprotein L3-like [Myripristis murdjan]|uniref:apolipoprotein L3-like n=1 Tax=Myripristis murdjan TaxID=586833 RepID=UPI001175F6F6|nr:apolipoprotein L3-like [Myripristis murdjan]